MSKKKRLIAIAAAAVLLAVTGVWLFRIIRLNQNYEQETQMVSMGESIEYGNIVYTVTDATIYDLPALMYEYPDFAWTIGMMDDMIEAELTDPGSEKVLVYTARFELGTDDVRGGVPTTYENENGSWSNMYNIWLFSCLNGENIGWKTGSTVELQVPVILGKNVFSDADWNTLEQDDCGLMLVLTYQPEKCGIRFDSVQHVHRDEAAEAYMKEIWADIEELRSNTEDPLMPKEENVFTEGSATVDGIVYEIGEVHEIEQEEAETYYEISSNFYDPNYTGRFFYTTVTIRNESEFMKQVSMGNTSIAVVQGEDVTAHTELSYISSPDYPDTKSNFILTLEPGESRNLELIYDTYFLADDETYLSKLEGDYYFLINPAGQQPDSINNKIMVYILYSNGLQ